MIFSDGRSTFNRDIYSNFTLHILNDLIDMEFILVKALHAGLKAHLNFEYRTAKTKSFQRAFQIDIDYCSVIQASKKSLSNRWFARMWKLGNYSSDCPVPPAYYYIHGWKLDGDLVPPFLAMGDYRIAGTLYYGKNLQNDSNSILKCTVNANLVD
ncbi:hypothetical protein KR093_010880 [Drosophila rubida]|uniref:Uncharacterized protein n=1 Tax=Drosophila rubida TaxID=30044 RepID=A0AAD4PMJ6_9MUSC|nr:hypothetical protein KR093_010880 [Drosophila rubida]